MREIVDWFKVENRFLKLIDTFISSNYQSQSSGSIFYGMIRPDFLFPVW